ncbi:MAG: hypothetical protein ABL900_02910 [Burkholderiaceae bacterium]
MTIRLDKTLAWAAPAALAAALAACGGGGSSAPPGPPAKAEGAYSGTLEGGVALQLLVLENDVFWAFYGTGSATSIDAVQGLIQGQGTYSAGAFTAAAGVDFAVGSSSAITLASTFSTDNNVGGTFSDATSGDTIFSSSRVAAATYDYTAAASLAAIAGSWALIANDGSSGSLSVAAGGALSADLEGCTLAGTLTPRASGKNVFDASITFGAAFCTLPNETISGVAIWSLMSDGVTRQLLMGGVNAARTGGVGFYGTK